MIGTIDYDMGNLASVRNAFVNKPEDIFVFDKLILPGVGAFGRAMELLDNSGLSTAIRAYVLEECKPLLGCLDSPRS